MSKHSVMVDADDFGGLPLVNQAVIKCFRNDSISSAMLIHNIPGFEEASEMVKSEETSGKISSTNKIC